jgi:hypothetical protein
MADEMKLVGVDNQNAAYQGDNTDSYAASIQQQYDKLAQQQAAAVNENVNEGVSALTYMKDKVAPELARQNLAAAKADRAEAIDRRDGIEINNGNRQQIGHSQYDIIENTYDNQREAIVDQQRKLELDTARQIADLRSKGDYAKADAALQSAQEKFKQLYKDSMRADTNLRANYEYGTSLKREDEKIVRDEERMNTKWLRSLGESFLQRGVMPSDGMLQAMGLDKDTAQLYVNAVLYGGYGYGGGGGGGGRRSGGSGGSGSSGGLVDSDAIEEQLAGPSYYKAFNQAYANTALANAKAGNGALAQETLDRGYQAGQFSIQNYSNLSKLVDQYSEKAQASRGTATKTTDYWNKYYGGSSSSSYSSSSSSSKKTTTTPTKKQTVTSGPVYEKSTKAKQTRAAVTAKKQTNVTSKAATSAKTNKTTKTYK